VSEPWYREGLRFACTRCGHCCTGEPGNVWISESEIEVIAERLGVSPQTMRDRYTTPRRRGVSLNEKSNNDCVFWSAGQGCTVYDIRPKQCRTWPFWRVNLRGPEDWADAGRACPGIDRGPIHDVQHIARTAADDGLPR
jgi:Fe-S-cluster containining protein